MEFFLVEKLALLRLRQRCIALRSGDTLFRMSDKRGAVRLTPAQAHTIQSHYRELIRPSGRVLGLSLWLQVPIVLLTMVLLAHFFRSSAVDAAIARVDALVPGLGVLLFTTWPLLLALIHHARMIGKANSGLDEFLESRAREPEPNLPAKKPLNGLEIVALLVVGPHILVDLVGSLSPHVLNNTPFTGRQLGVTDLIGIAVCVGFRLLRRRVPAVIDDPAPAASPEPVAAAGQVRRRQFGQKRIA